MSEPSVFYLSFLSGNQRGKNRALKPGTLTIGRAEECDVQLKGDRVAYKHAELQVQADDTIMIECVGPSELYVNDVKVYQTTLREDDLILIGTTLIKVEKESSSNVRVREMLAARMSSPQYALRFVSGRYQGGEYPISGGRDVVVGSTKTSEIVLDDSLTSPRHAKFFLEDGNLILKDLDSAKGTFVNGEQIQRRILEAGDRVMIGSTIIRIGKVDSNVQVSPEA